MGMPRRYWDYSHSPEFQILNVLSTAGATILAVGYLLPMVYFLWSMRYGKPAPDNPWNAAGLEWTIPSPPTTLQLRRAASRDLGSLQLRRDSTNAERGSPLHTSPPATVEGEAHENPALLHHFATEEQQKNAASLGMWLFLITEIMFFGGMFCAYLVYRYSYFGDFAAASSSLNLTLGTVNTIVLIGSSLTVAMAVRCAQVGKQKAIVVYLMLTIVLGLAFLGIKAKEYKTSSTSTMFPAWRISISMRHIPRHPDVPVNQNHAQIYFSIYFAMTGMHALHMIIGVGLFAYLTYKAYKGSLRAAILHAARERRVVLALCRYCLDLSIPVAVPDRPSSVRRHV